MNKNNEQVALKPEHVSRLLKLAFFEMFFFVMPAVYFFLCSGVVGEVSEVMPVLIDGKIPNILAGAAIFVLGNVFLLRQVIELQSEPKKDQSRQSQ